MINVNNNTIQAWLSDRKVNTVVISFPELHQTYGIDDIDCDSFSLKESLCNADEMEFVGCIASSLKVAIYNIPNDVKGKRITVSVKAGDTETIPLFKGIVDSVEIDADSLFKNIIAYDDLYLAGQVDVADWYARLALPMTLGAIRASLMSYVGLTEVANTELPNDDVTIYRTLENPDTIQALTVIKSICQINGACGIINRDGKFEYRYVKTSMQTSYNIPFHESLKYEEFYCNAIQRVQIRDTEEDAGVVTSSYGNKYIVQANMFAYELATDVLRSMASNILNEINGFTYHPMRSVQNGLPFIEVGDTIEYNVSSEGYGIDTFLILSRTISGIQFCRDTFESRGVQDQSEYISDLQAQVDVLKRTTNELKNLSSKIVDYILPTDIEESNISSGSSSDVLEFEFYCNDEEEKSSFYSSLNFTIATDVDSNNDVYGDCTLTVTYYKDGTAVEVQTHTFGDGSFMVMLNYLLSNMSVGNHNFTVRFALSGGSMSSIQVISAYLLAATAVESGNYSEDYEIDVDEDFAEYMTEIDQEIVGEYVHLDPPRGGSGSGDNFSGNKFCDDWYVAFERPEEYLKIAGEVGPAWLSLPDSCFKDIDNPDAWSGFLASDMETIIPQAIDDDVYGRCGKHVNFWAMTYCIYNGRVEPRAWGAYMGSTGALRCRGNYPTKGYIDFDFNRTGDITMYNGGGNYTGWSRGINATTGAWYTDWDYNHYYIDVLRLVYNVEAYEQYLRDLGQNTINPTQIHYILAECNIKKEKHQTSGVTDWSDNDDYHGE